MSSRSRPSRSKPSGNARLTAARLAAVQALYQMEMTGVSAGVAVDEFVTHRSGQELDGDSFVPPDVDRLRELVRGTAEMQQGLDAAITEALDGRHDLGRLERLLRAILRVGAFELTRDPEAGVAPIINDYIDIAKGFFGGTEPSLVNAALDRIAKAARAETARE